MTIKGAKELLRLKDQEITELKEANKELNKLVIFWRESTNKYRHEYEWMNQRMNYFLDDKNNISTLSQMKKHEKIEKVYETTLLNKIKYQQIQIDKLTKSETFWSDAARDNRERARYLETELQKFTHSKNERGKVLHLIPVYDNFKQTSPEPHPNECKIINIKTINKKSNLKIQAL